MVVIVVGDEFEFKKSGDSAFSAEFIHSSNHSESNKARFTHTTSAQWSNRAQFTRKINALISNGAEFIYRTKSQVLNLNENILHLYRRNNSGADFGISTMELKVKQPTTMHSWPLMPLSNR